MKPAVCVALIPFMTASAQNYSATRVQVDGIEVARLVDKARNVEVSIVPSIGNTAYEMKVNGKNVFWFPSESLGVYKQKPVFSGNPFLAPWANRLDHDGFYANGKHYTLDRGLKNYRSDANDHPIHGLLTYAKEWVVADLKSDANSAEVRSRLEFWRYPDYMAQFPFAHTIEMIYRLQNGGLEVETIIENHSTETMPVSVGYHPYFRIHDVPRDQWIVNLPARDSVVLSPQLVPTGETKPLAYKSPLNLAGVALDDVMSGLIRGEYTTATDRSTLWLSYTRPRVATLFVSSRCRAQRTRSTSTRPGSTRIFSRFRPAASGARVSG
jgi:aldose 1-epimerase